MMTVLGRPPLAPLLALAAVLLHAAGPAAVAADCACGPTCCIADAAPPACGCGDACGGCCGDHGCGPNAADAPAGEDACGCQFGEPAPAAPAAPADDPPHPVAVASFTVPAGPAVAAAAPVHRSSVVPPVRVPVRVLLEVWRL